MMTVNFFLFCFFFEWTIPLMFSLYFIILFSCNIFHWDSLFWVSCVPCALLGLSKFTKLTIVLFRAAMLYGLFKNRKIKASVVLVCKFTWNNTILSLLSLLFGCLDYSSLFIFSFNLKCTVSCCFTVSRQTCGLEWFQEIIDLMITSRLCM